MSRALGEALATARKGGGYLGRPVLLAAKLARAWRRRRGLGAYRESLARGEFLVVPPHEPAAIRFTVVMPVHRVAEEHLRAAIASVKAQTYGSWELVLIDDASPDAHVGLVLAEAARSDARITALHRADTGGIAAASNEGLRHGRGEYVAFLDHDDLIHPRALELAARFLAGAHDVDWLFTDEDKIDETGLHHEPCLKPGWSHHLLLSFNYVAHLRIVRRALLDRLGGHRLGYDGAQDYDLGLRAVAAGGRFAHLPGILYHWRTVARSMARLAGAKPQAHDNAVRALAEHARAWPRGGDVSSEVLLEPASLFHVRRAADPATTIAVLADRATFELPGKTGRTLVFAAPPADFSDSALLIESVRRCSAEIVVVPPARGLDWASLEELLALLTVPGTAIAAARLVAGSRVRASGWVVADDRTLRDPWAGLRPADPGYLNLAIIPGPRALPPPLGWAGRRGDLIAGWDAARDIPPAWRLAVGLARLGPEIVTTPAASFPLGAGPLAPPPPPAPSELPARWEHWLDQLHLL